MKKKTTIGLIQIKVSNKPITNIENSIKKIKEAAKKNAKIICLPELFLSPYFCQTENYSKFKLAEKIPGPMTNTYCKLAKELSIILMISLFEKKLTGFYHNTSVVINEKGKIISKYRKMHIPDDPGYYEKFYFSPGDLGFKSTKTRYGKIGSLICWDQWFPEAARLTALKGAEILFYPTAIGDEIMSTYDSSDAWQTVMQGHAAANIMPVVASNRIGSESVKGQVNGFYGKSFICNRSGKIIAEASKDMEEVIIAEIDTEENHLFRRNWGLFRDRRPELYKEILSLNGETKD